MHLKSRFNPINALHKRHQALIQQVEQEANGGALTLPQPARWATRLTQVMLLGLTAVGIWSVVARVDVVVAARGKLEPLSQTQVVQSRIGGVITAVSVREGETVKQGQLLMQIDKTALQTQLQTLLAQKKRLLQEVEVLRLARQGATPAMIQQKGGVISPELMNRIQSRSLLTAQLTRNPQGLAPEQRQRYDLFQQQLQNRLSISQLQASNLQAQIAVAESQADKSTFQFKVEQGLLNKLQPLADQGAIARADVLQRSVDVNALQSQINQAQLQKSQLQLSQQQAHVETQRLIAETDQSIQQQLASLDTQFDSTIDANERQLIQIESQLKQVQHDLQSQDLRAPAQGVVFNLAHKLPGVVSQPGQVLLQVVPSESLIARIQVANADIATIEEGMPVDLRIDAYPFTEFGSIRGVVTKIGREALPVNQQLPGQTVFPIEVKLERQSLEHQVKSLALVPGMTLVANVKVRSRAPISYIADELIKAFDSLRSVR